MNRQHPRQQLNKKVWLLSSLFVFEERLLNRLSSYCTFGSCSSLQLRRRQTRCGVGGFSARSSLPQARNSARARSSRTRTGATSAPSSAFVSVPYLFEPFCSSLTHDSFCFVCFRSRPVLSCSHECVVLNDHLIYSRPYLSCDKLHLLIHHASRNSDLHQRRAIAVPQPFANIS